MKFLRVILMAGIASAGAQAADREFSDVVRAISDEFGTHPMRIPLFGIVNAFVAVARPAGAKHIDIAIFENLGDGRRSGGSVPDMIRSTVGAAWKPFVQVRSSRKGREETVLIYLRGENNDWKLLVTSIDRHEAVVAQIRLNPDGLARWIKSPEDSARHWNGSFTEDRDR